MLEFSPYQAAWRADVLAVFESNTPDFFNPVEASDLSATLDNPDGPHWVATELGEVVGYGGFEVGVAYNRVVLTWGMVRRDLHGRGLGRGLLAHRVREAAAATAGGTRWLMVDTTPAVAGFYRRCGFEQVEVWPQGYRAGFDMVVLRMAFGSPEMERLLDHSAFSRG